MKTESFGQELFFLCDVELLKNAKKCNINFFVAYRNVNISDKYSVFMVTTLQYAVEMQKQILGSIEGVEMISGSIDDLEFV
jgi:thioredoxin-related protein